MIGVASFILAPLFIGLARAEYSGCDVSNATIQLPSNQTQLVTPNNTTPSLIALAVGVQNYTCSNTSTWTPVGAVAELFDVSCLVNDPAFLDLQSAAFDAWNSTPAGINITGVMSMFQGASSVLGQHYYVENAAGNATLPKWDFTSAAFNGDETAFVIGAKMGDIPAPAGNQTDVDWVSLTNMSGSLASMVFRVDTLGGQPPTACSVWDGPLSVKYAAKYWFFGGSFNGSSTTPPPQ